VWTLCIIRSVPEQRQSYLAGLFASMRVELCLSAATFIKCGFLLLARD
jgi:hypothetical protein